MRLLLRLQRGDEIRNLGTVPALAGIEAGSLERGRDPLAPVLGLRLSDLPRWLLLPAGSSLRRRLPLPAAAVERLRDVVGFEIERQTPFAADAVAFDARVLARREGEGRHRCRIDRGPARRTGSAAGGAWTAGAVARRHRCRRQRRHTTGSQSAAAGATSPQP